MQDETGPSWSAGCRVQGCRAPLLGAQRAVPCHSQTREPSGHAGGPRPQPTALRYPEAGMGLLLRASRPSSLDERALVPRGCTTVDPVLNWLS